MKYLLNYKKRRNFAFCYNMNEAGEDYTKDSSTNLTRLWESKETKKDN